MGFQEAKAAMFRSLRDVWSADSQNTGQGKVQYWTEMSVWASTENTNASMLESHN